jgi:hypothetical protein
MRYLIILLTFFLVGCSSIPLEKEFDRIHAKKYVKKKYDCSNKSSEYYDALKKAGYEPQIVRTFYWGIVVQKNGKTEVLVPIFSHALVYCNGWYLDPTTGHKYRNKAWLHHYWKPNVLTYLDDKEFEELKKHESQVGEWDY